MGFLHWGLHSHPCTEFTWTSEILASTPKISFFFCESWMYFFAWAFFWTMSVVPTPIHHWLRLLTSVSFLLKKRPGLESSCVVFLTEYERQIVVLDFVGVLYVNLLVEEKWRILLGCLHLKRFRWGLNLHTYTHLLSPHCSSWWHPVPHFFQWMECIGTLLPPFPSQELFFLSVFLISIKSFLPVIQKLTSPCHGEGVILKILPSNKNRSELRKIYETELIS